MISKVNEIKRNIANLAESCTQKCLTNYTNSFSCRAHNYNDGSDNAKYDDDDDVGCDNVKYFAKYTLKIRLHGTD